MAKNKWTEEEIEFLKNNQDLPLDELVKNVKHSKKVISNMKSKDRIDSNKGYVEGNVQWVCKEINFMKHALSESRFIELCKLVYLYNQSMKGINESIINGEK